MPELLETHKSWTPVSRLIVGDAREFFRSNPESLTERARGSALRLLS